MGVKPKYHDLRSGLNYKIVGLLEIDNTYETYYAKHSNPNRHLVIHVLRNGDSPRYKAKRIDEDKVRIRAQKKSATRKEQVLPWEGNQD